MRKAFIRDALSLVLSVAVHKLALYVYECVSRSKLLDIALSRYPCVQIDSSCTPSVCFAVNLYAWQHS
jgi:hypothetical protein